MENDNNFFGRRFIKKGAASNRIGYLDRVIVSDSVKRDIEFGKEKYPNEREKTKEEIELLRRIHGYIEEEFISIGIPAPFIVPLESIHFISGQGGPVANMQTRSIAVNPENSHSTLAFAKTLIHEMLHLYSFGVFMYDRDKLGTGKAMSTYRSGYKISNMEGNQNEDGRYEHFRALNEGVIDRMAVEILSKHVDDIGDVYKDSPEKIKKGDKMGSYIEQILLLNIIMNVLSAGKGKTFDDIWKTFKRGLFTGEMMHLRDIERVYGSGSLRVLDRSIPDPDKAEEIAKTAKIIRYFSSVSLEERDRLKMEILQDQTSRQDLDNNIEALIHPTEGQNGTHEAEGETRGVAEIIKEGDPAELQKLADRFDVA